MQKGITNAFKTFNSRILTAGMDHRVIHVPKNTIKN